MLKSSILRKWKSSQMTEGYNMLMEIKNLTKLYPNHRGISGLNLTIEPGEVVALLGPNGAGKTTALKAIVGFLQNKSGEVLFKGISVAENPEKTLARIGLMIGEPAPYPYLTGLQFLRLNRGLYPNITDEKIQVSLKEVDLLEFQKDKIKTYSTGMKQRLTLAKALLHEPELILLDEPFSGMDIEGRAEMVGVIKKLSQSKGTAILISSHLIHDIEELTSKVCIIHKGEWVVTEAASKILTSYPSLEAFYLMTVQGRKAI